MTNWNFQRAISLVTRSGVNFINILRALFLYESELSNFSLVEFDFFGAKINGSKDAHKMLMKLTTVRK